MTRAHICDPELTARVRAGESERIRPCVGANTCIANRYAGKPIRCMHNAEIATPGTRLTVSGRPREVVVIGAGPAGLEAARVAAERGHAVRVFEAGPRPGGQLLLWSALASTAEFAAIVDWRVAELRRLGVAVHCNRRITAGGVDGLDFDVLVIATGARDHVRPLAGPHAIRVLSPHEVLREPRIQARKAVVLNEGRGQAGLVAAERLREQGVAVEVLTSDVAVGNDLDPTVRNAWYTRLGRAGCGFGAGLVAVEARGRTLVLRNVFDERRSTREDVDLLVDWAGCRADEAFHGFRGGREQHAIGDCVAPRNLEVAIAEALAAASHV